MSNNHPNLQPPSLHSLILDCRSVSLSVLERSSNTKSGQIGGKLSFSHWLKEFHRAEEIKAKSGDRMAVDDRRKAVEESKKSPNFLFLFHTLKK